MDRCKDCSNWVGYGSLYPKNTASEAKRAGGLCSSEKLDQGHGSPSGADMLVYFYAEGGDFWTGPEFGCVHFTERDLG